jgi:hypothetical protein
MDANTDVAVVVVVTGKPRRSCCVCQRRAPWRCKACPRGAAPFYCTRFCQLIDWDTGHREACRKTAAAAAQKTMMHRRSV